MNTLQMPEDTKDQISDKIKCFAADDCDLKAEMEANETRYAQLKVQREINRHHMSKLFIKYRGICQPIRYGENK